MPSVIGCSIRTPDFKAFEEGTTKLDRADMEKAKDLFYDVFGWDRTTGVPHPRDAGEV